MDGSSWIKNITGYLTKFDLKLCDLGKDICFNRGYCVTAKSHQSASVCICHPCYRGEYFQDETLSNNIR
ncbi:unnamed protein product, partial [Rotaria magnacalcarata]